MPTPSGQLSYQLRIELDEVAPAVWRRILVPTNVRMSKLHDILQGTMGWTDSHMHAFEVGDARYGTCFDDFPEDEIDEQQVTVLEALQGHAHFVYEYDFGDCWSHTIKVEDEIRTPKSLRFAVCLAGENACPPEDSGGSGGYERMLEALSDPNNENHDTYLHWIGRDTFDRTAFDIVAVNAALQSIPQRTSRVSNAW
ncbi:MAG TPA: plasmid pRiA4b ORF-3 family protein [Acidimicrobiales bacterium]|nr:plasmid pRiA4b ORF-3 family protein [Acidimicrobiales bacterium]